MTAVRTGLAKVKGTKLYYEVAGEGDPIVLIHGFTLDTRMWDDQFDAFAQSHTVIRYDVRGFGKSALPGTRPYTDEDDLKGLLDHLEVSRAHILGLSMGGGIAVEFALAYPGSLHTLIVVGTVDVGFDLSEEYANTLRAIWSKGKTEGVEAAREAWLRTPHFKASLENSAAGPRLRKMISEYSGWEWSHESPQIERKIPAAERLHEIKAPTLIIVGELDVMYFHRVADLVTRRIPNARKVVLPGVGHMPNMENPRVFNKTVLEFLTGIHRPR